MRGQLRTLARHTFAGFFESDLMPPGLPQVRLVIFAIAVLMFPATQIPLRAGKAYFAASRFAPDVLDLLMWPHKLLFITLAMVGTAVVSLIIWDNVFPDRREAFVIGHLPIRTRTRVLARLLALSQLMALIALGSALPSALFYGTLAGHYSPGGIVRTVVAHFAATMGASVFAFLLLLSLQGVLINVVPGRWLQRGIILVQFLFVVAALEAMLFMHPVIEGMESVFAPGAAAGAGWMAWAPPAWFLAMYEVIAGTSRPVGRFAVPAVISLATLVPFACGLYAFTYRRLTRRAIEERDSERIGGGVGREPAAASVSAALTRSPIAAAVSRFSVVTLLRSRKQRLLLTIFAGVGTTAAATGILVPLSRHGRFSSTLTAEAILPVGLVLVFFLVVGLRTLYAIPAEPAANWIFKLSDAEDARRHVQGAGAAIVCLAVLPVPVVLAPIHVFVLGPVAAAVHTGLLLSAGFLLSEIVLNGFRRVPFTSVYNAPAMRIQVMWPFWLVGYLVFSFTLSSLERALLGRPLPLAVLLSILLSAGFVVRWWRERNLRLADRMLTFDDGEQENAPVTLELGGILPEVRAVK